MIGAAPVAGALALLLVGRDLVIKPEGADQPGAIRLLHLFTYNYRRAWPDSLDFSAILLGVHRRRSALAIAGARFVEVATSRRVRVRRVCRGVGRLGSSTSTW